MIRGAIAWQGFTAEINAFIKDSSGLKLGYSKLSWSAVSRKTAKPAMKEVLQETMKV